MEQGVKDVQQKGTREEKIEKNFKKTSERKKERQSEEETKKFFNVADVEEGVKDV